MNNSQIVENIQKKLVNAFFNEASQYQAVVTENNLLWGMQHAAVFLNRVLHHHDMKFAIEKMNLSNIDLEVLNKHE